MKPLAKMLIVGLILGAIVGLGCGQKRIETVYVKPQCTVPPLPADLPDPDVDYIFDKLGKDVAEQLLTRERLIVDSLMEHRARLQKLCEDSE